MPIATIPVKLSVDIMEDDVIASILVSNNSIGQLYLDAFTICLDNKFRNNIFSIYDENGKLVSYSGRRVHRVVNPEDFIEIKPGESIAAKITVNKGYRLVKGHKYVLQYLAYNPSYEGMQQTIGMQSNKVEISY